MAPWQLTVFFWTTRQTNLCDNHLRLSIYDESLNNKRPSDTLASKYKLHTATNY